MIDYRMRSAVIITKLVVIDPAERNALLAEAAALRRLAREARSIAKEDMDDFVRNILTKRAEEFENEAEALETRAQLH